MASETDRNKKVQGDALSMQEKLIIAVRAATRLIPFGIGGAIDQLYFGTVEKRRSKRIEKFITELAHQIEQLGPSAQRTDYAYFETDEFAHLLEGVLRRVTVEVAQEKLNALRGALVTIITGNDGFPFDVQCSFVSALDRMEALHVHTLAYLSAQKDGAAKPMYAKFSTICQDLNAKTEREIDFLYSVIDTLCNLQYTQVGAVPFDQTGAIDKANQLFKITALGRSFLAYTRSPTSSDIIDTA